MMTGCNDVCYPNPKGSTQRANGNQFREDPKMNGNDRPLGVQTSPALAGDVPTSNDGKSGGLSVHDGWVLVPREPTEHMLEQIYKAGKLLDEIDLWPAAEIIYNAMLSAAPQPPKENE